MQVLVADDDSTARKILESALFRWGYDPICATDGLEALRIIQSTNPPRMLVLDWMMPGMNGPEICRQVRENSTSQYIYIILLTSKTDRQDMLAGIDSGADVFLSKPVDLEDLKIRIAAGRRIINYRPPQPAPTPFVRKVLTPEKGIWELPAELLAVAKDLTNDLLIAIAPRVKIENHDIPVLGKVLLLEKLGQGGMGAVYRGYNPRTRSHVAVKVVSSALFRDDAKLAERFYREAQIAAVVKSPHLVAVFDIDQESGLLYLVMELVSGLSAAKYLRDTNQSGKVGLNEDEALIICLAATKGLAAAHSNGIIHRDVKPENILIPLDAALKLDFASAKLADLGIARHEEKEGLTGTNTALGTVGFMAPEQIQDASTAGKPADFFSLGVTLHVLLAGKLPFVADSPFNMLLETINTPHVSIRAARPDVTPMTTAILDRCLAKSPQARYQNATALIEDLEQALRHCMH